MRTVNCMCVTSVIRHGHSGRTGGQEPPIRAEEAMGALDSRRRRGRRIYGSPYAAPSQASFNKHENGLPVKTAG